MKRLRVEVNLAAGIDADDLAEIRSIADHVVIATGSRPADLPVGLAGRPAATVDQVLLGGAPEVEGRHALVYDEGDGFWPAYSAAEALVQQGWRVTLATPLTALASRVPAESVGPLLGRLGARDVAMLVAHELVVPEDPAAPLTLRPVFGGRSLELPASLAVWHEPRVPVAPFGVDPGEGLSVIGDCVSPRRISHAIAEGTASTRRSESSLVWKHRGSFPIPS